MDLAWAICFVQGTCWIEDDSSLGGKQVLQGGDTVWELSVILWDIILCQFEIGSGAFPAIRKQGSFEEAGKVGNLVEPSVPWPRRPHRRWTLGR